jgi:ABC-2 type transport system ATP-binding protein
MPAIEVENLSRIFNSLRAVDNISFSVDAGEIFGFLGHNGAGKTTTIRMLSGQLLPTSGRGRVAGCDIVTEQQRLKPLIGVVSEHQNLYERMSGLENLEFAARLYGQDTQRIGAALKQVDLLDRAGDKVQNYSNGMKQRLLIARSILHGPQIVFLDEPTRGLDPIVGREIRRLIVDMSKQGVTIFLTTHYMEEAQYLADRAAIIVDGQVIAEGSPAELGRSTGADTEVRFRLPDGVGAPELPLAFASAQADNGFVTLRTGEPVKALNELTGWALERDVDLSSIEVGRPSLEDVYLELTGRDEDEQ